MPNARKIQSPRCMAQLSFATLCILFAQAGAAKESAAELAAVQAGLMSRNQLNVFGELLYEMPAEPSQVRQYEKFGLRFDRPTGRLRVTYTRAMGQQQHVEFEAWGTIDCLDMLRVDRQSAELFTAKMHTCKKIDTLYSMMSEATGVFSVPGYILKGEVEGTLFKSNAGPVTISRARNGTQVTIKTTAPHSNYLTNYWLTSSGTALTNVEVRDGGLFRARANLTHDEANLQDKDFAFTPDPVVVAMAGINYQPQDPAKIRELAEHGNKAAKAALLASDKSLAGMMMGAVGEDGFHKLEELQKLDVGWAFTIEGQCIGRLPVEVLPTEYKTWTKERRAARAVELILEGARRCDGQALVELSQPFDLITPANTTPAMLAAIKSKCASSSVPEEATAASSRFAQSWP